MIAAFRWVSIGPTAFGRFNTPAIPLPSLTGNPVLTPARVRNRHSNQHPSHTHFGSLRDTADLSGPLLPGKPGIPVKPVPQDARHTKPDSQGSTQGRSVNLWRLRIVPSFKSIQQPRPLDIGPGGVWATPRQNPVDAVLTWIKAENAGETDSCGYRGPKRLLKASRAKMTKKPAETGRVRRGNRPA